MGGGALVEWLTRSRVSGTAAVTTGVVRIVSGLAFVVFSSGKFLDHAKEVADFDAWGVPWPEGAVYVVGVLELVGGILLISGLLTRLAALGLAGDMVGAIATAGRVEGGVFHLGVAPLMLAIMGYLVWAGPGRWSLDDRASRARPTTAP